MLPVWLFIIVYGGVPPFIVIVIVPFGGTKPTIRNVCKVPSPTSPNSIAVPESGVEEQLTSIGIIVTTSHSFVAVILIY